MDSTSRFKFSTAQAVGVTAAAASARSFVESQGFALGVAFVDHAWYDGSAADVIEQLARYQNPDGGFGRRLEVDIASPASNPFAARLAMHVLLGLRDRPHSDLAFRLGEWLVTNQDEDGDWHFSEETKTDDLPPWFAGWTFPGLNPACCIAGLANQLGIATPQMLDRVAALYSEKASLDEARAGEFYDLLPYVEYAGGVDFPDRDAYLESAAGNIIASEAGESYADAAHFWELVLGGGPELARLIPPAVLERQAERLISEQAIDGGWPTPYDQAWRPIVTTQNCSTLARLKAGI